MARCPHCAAQLVSLAVCTACKRLLAVSEDATPFEMFGIEPAFGVDVKSLRKELLKISREIHPDFFGTASEEMRALAERNSARLNKAFEVLSDEATRADWLIASLGGPDESTERAMPQAFLMEVLEWNELLEEARASGAKSDPRLAELERTLLARREESMRAIGALLDPLPARGAIQLKRARQELNAVRYVDRALGEIEALRLQRSASS
jgi:molecular chaperone HscB